MRRYLCLIGLCLMSWLPNATLQAKDYPRDSILAQLPQMKHDSVRLRTLVDLVYAFQQSKQEEPLVRQLIDEARLQGDLNQESLGLYMLMLDYYNNSDETDSLVICQERIRQIAEQTGEWEHYFNGNELVINTYNYQHRYEYAIGLAQQMAQEATQKQNISGLVSAYYCLSYSYKATRRFIQQHEVLFQAYELFPQLTSDDLKLDVLAALVQHCAYLKNWPDMKLFADELHRLIDRNVQSSLSGEEIFSNQLIFTESYLMRYHVALQEYDEARRYMTQIGQRLNSHTFLPTRNIYLTACMEYQAAIGNYDEALAYSDTILTHIAQNPEYGAFQAEQLYRRGVLLQQMGRYHDAVEYFQREQAWQDSVSRVILDEQVEEIQRVHNLDQILLRQVTLRENTQLALLILVSLLLICCFFYIHHIRSLRKTLRKAQRETEESTRLSEKANEVKGLFLNNLRQIIRKPIHTVVELSQRLASDTTLSEEQRQQYAKTITVNTNQLIQLVNSVLDLSRLEADMTKWQIGPCDLVQICRDAISSIRLHRPSTDIEFECGVTQQLVQTDGKRMMQLIESCLSSSANSLCPHGDTSRHVRFSLQQEGVMLRFRIWGSHLATPCKDCYEKNIRNDINRLTIKHFGGVYTIGGETPNGAFLEFTYPIG